MSIAKTPANIAGETTNAAATTAVYTNIATASGALDSTNSQTEWVSTSHINTSVQQVFNTDPKVFTNSSAQFVLTSAAYTVVDFAGTPMRVVYGPVLLADNGGDRLRVHADINVDAVGVINLPADMTSDQDTFYLQLWYRDGTGAYFPFSSEWGYSVTNYTDYPTFAVNPAYPGQLGAYAMTHPRRRFGCSVTGFLNGQASGVDRIELRARLDTVATVASVTFEEATLTTFMVRN